MSQVKAPPTPTPVQPPHATSHGQAQALSPPSRITTRRSSRSPHSTIATNNSKDTTQDSSSATEEVVTSPESTNGVTTRSRSMDTQQTKDTSNPPDPNQTDTNTKKKRTTASKPIPSRKRSAKQSSASPTTPIPSSVPTLRASKTSARATKRIEAPASRASVRRKRKEPSDGHVPEVDIEHKRQRLSELDEFEKSILDGTHPEYQQHMNNIQEKRQKKIAVAESLYKFQVQNCQSAFEAVKKAALDRFYEQKRNLRLKMIQEIQTKIKLLEQEYNVMQDYETYSSDDEDRQIPLTEWVPPSRHASIYILFSNMIAQ